jgi:hypothetical protein
MIMYLWFYDLDDGRNARLLNVHQGGQLKKKQKSSLLYFVDLCTYKNYL